MAPALVLRRGNRSHVHATVRSSHSMPLPFSRFANGVVFPLPPLCWFTRTSGWMVGTRQSQGRSWSPSTQERSRRIRGCSGSISKRDSAGPFLGSRFGRLRRSVMARGFHVCAWHTPVPGYFQHASLACLVPGTRQCRVACIIVLPRRCQAHASARHRAMAPGIGLESKLFSSPFRNGHALAPGRLCASFTWFFRGCWAGGAVGNRRGCH